MFNIILISAWLGGVLSGAGGGTVIGPGFNHPSMMADNSGGDTGGYNGDDPEAVGPSGKLTDEEAINAEYQKLQDLNGTDVSIDYSQYLMVRISHPQKVLVTKINLSRFFIQDINQYRLMCDYRFADKNFRLFFSNHPSRKLYLHSQVIKDSIVQASSRQLARTHLDIALRYSYVVGDAQVLIDPEIDKRVTEVASDDQGINVSDNQEIDVEIYNAGLFYNPLIMEDPSLEGIFDEAVKVVFKLPEPQLPPSSTQSQTQTQSQSVNKSEMRCFLRRN